MKPELLAIRAINEYHSYNKLSYLGLRYYLDNKCARRDAWVNEVAVHLTTNRSTGSYLRYSHFKGISENNSVVHRDIYIPGTNEILAEASLINACSKYEEFHSLPCVYSYQFPKSNSKEGIYQKYFQGLKQRHKDIAKFCKADCNSTVTYTDIKKFYPNITKELAVKVWENTCKNSRIENKYKILGNKLLEDHSKVASTTDNKGILTGPMISHLIANLLLKDIDEKMSKIMANKYWRYVDDVTIAGEKKEVEEARNLLKNLLEEKGLNLHTGDKDFTISSSEWLEGEEDFESQSTLWPNFIANIKRFLVLNPGQKDALARAFSDNEININLPSYAAAADESSYIEKLKDWLYKYDKWAVKKASNLSVASLVKEAFLVRDSLYREMELLLQNEAKTDYDKKRLVPKLRHCAGRLVYLGKSDYLSFLSNELCKYGELYMLSKVLDAVISRDVTELIKLGNNAVQAAAQILYLKDDPVIFSLEELTEVEKQGLAILQLNGVRVEGEIELNTELSYFALEKNMRDLMKSDDLFIREIACLHGIDNDKRNLSLMSSAFDRYEELAFDVISLYCTSSG